MNLNLFEVQQHVIVKAAIVLSSSRVFMHLQVLDEIHRQPLPFSVSMVLLPAPEDVVDSFPLKNHEKHITTDCDDEVGQ